MRTVIARKARARTNWGKVARFVKGYAGPYADRAVRKLRSDAGKWGRDVVRGRRNILTPFIGSGRRSRSAPKRKGPSSGDRYVKIYNTKGRMGPRFRRNGFSRVNRFVTQGYIRKRESGAVVTDPQCVYIGHNTFALEDSLNAIALSILRQFAKKAGQDFVNVDQFVSNMNTNPNVELRVSYKVLPDGLIAFATYTTIAQITWSNLALQLVALWKTAATNTEYFELLTVEMYGLDTLANTRDFPFLSFEAKQLIITLVGNSSLALQNTTLASVTDTDGDHIENISNNPLTGKQYFGFGQNFPLAFQNVIIGPENNTSPKTNNSTGIVTFDWSAANAMSANMRDMVKKPPPYYAFSGMKSGNYVQIAPGEIKRSKMTKAYTMDLMKMMQMLTPYIAISPGGVGSAVKYFGKVTLFGLERMLDSRSDEADIRLAYEVNLTTSAVARYRPSLKIVPQVFN